MAKNGLRKIKKRVSKHSNATIYTMVFLAIWTILHEYFETVVSDLFVLDSFTAGIAVGFFFIITWFAGLQKWIRS